MPDIRSVSNFLNSLQVVGFGDIGTAWSGKSPWDSFNGYATEKLTNGPVTVTLDSNREPIVEGFGVGARAQILGYFVRADWAWGIDNGYVLPEYSICHSASTSDFFSTMLYK